MKQFLKLAWRNLWRNRRRTLITLASVFMAVALSIAIRALQKGSYNNMIVNAVRFSTGYIQIHSKGYWDDQTINNAFVADRAMDSLLQRQANVSLAVPRLESFALASAGVHTKGVAIIGVDPALEEAMNGLASKVQQGHYLQNSDSAGILVGDGLAKYLELKLGDTLVLLGQGYHGSTAAGKYPVSGIFHFPLEQINNSVVYLSLPGAQSLFGAPDMLTSVSLMLRNTAQMEQTRRQLEQQLGNEREVMAWQDMNKALVQEIQGDNAGGLIMLAILYMVVAFGVFGTILMMALERKKEFAVLIAIGMRRGKLMWVLLMETILIGLLGVLAGIVVMYPFVWHFHVHPIRLTGKVAETYTQMGFEPVMPMSIDPGIFLSQGVTVVLITLVSVLYPLVLIRQLPVAETIKQ